MSRSPLSKALRRVGLVLLLASALGTSGATCFYVEPEPAPEPEVERTPWQRYVGAYLAWLDRCEPQSSRYSFWERVEPELHERMLSREVARRFQLETFAALRSTGNVYVDEELLPGCLDALSNEACVTAPPLSCEAVMRGRLAEQEACSLSAECASRDCRVSVWGECGRCAAASAEGEPCWDRSCGAGLYCDWLNGVCAPKVQVGESCQLSEACHGSSQCSLGEREEPSPDDVGTCLAPPPAPVEGDDCGVGGQPCGDPLATGLFCAASGGQPVCRDITLSPPGGACNGEPFNSSGGAWCERAFSTNRCDPATGTCKPLPSVGEQCEESRCNGLEASCDRSTNTCVALPDDGEACLSQASPQCALSAICVDEGGARVCRDNPFAAYGQLPVVLDCAE